jgi:hypothetical protein
MSAGQIITRLNVREDQHGELFLSRSSMAVDPLGEMLALCERFDICPNCIAEKIRFHNNAALCDEHAKESMQESAMAITDADETLDDEPR